MFKDRSGKRFITDMNYFEKKANEVTKTIFDMLDKSVYSDDIEVFIKEQLSIVADAQKFMCIEKVELIRKEYTELKNIKESIKITKTIFDMLEKPGVHSYHIEKCIEKALEEAVQKYSQEVSLKIQDVNNLSANDVYLAMEKVDRLLEEE